MKKYLTGLFVMLSMLFLLMTTAFASTDYTITDIRLTDLKGNAIDYDGGSCMVNVTVTKNTNVDDGYVVISTYTEDETLIGFNYLFTSLEEGKSATLGAMVSLPDTEKIGEVKAMVWDSLDGMTPLATSKTLIPGEEIEPEPTPTPEPTSVQIDGTLINEQTGSYPGVEIRYSTTVDPDEIPASGDEFEYTDATLRIRKSAISSQSSAEEYRLINADLYVNDEFFCNVNSANADAVQSMLKASTGMTTLVQDPDYEGEVYNKIYMDYYVIANVSDIVEESTICTQLRFTGITSMPNSMAATPGSSLYVYNADIEDGYATVNVTRNGEQCTLSDIEKNDVVALKYNIRCSLTNLGMSFDKIDIIATTDTVTGQCTSYDADINSYYIDYIEYKAVKSIEAMVSNIYKFRLDPFGRLYDAEEQSAPKNYAIVERYVDLAANPAFNSEYDYLDVVTFDGQSQRLYIEDNSRYAVRGVMAAAGINASLANNAAIPMENRIIEYEVKTSTGRVREVSADIAAVYGFGRYNAANNRFNDLQVAENALVLDATKYETYNPSASDYEASSLGALSPYVDYEYILAGQNNNGEYECVIIVAAGATYHAGSDFAVVASSAHVNNIAIVDDEEVYQLNVMQNGDNDATRLNISMNAMVYMDGYGDYYSNNCVPYLQEGAVFYYTTDSYGLVDRIDVVLHGDYDYDDIKMFITEEYDDVSPTIWNLIAPPASAMVSPMTWFVDVDKNDVFGMDETIQLFIAPVVKATTNSVTFGAVEGDGDSGVYVNTNNQYVFSIADDANIYEYDLADKGIGKYAFRAGTFAGFNIDETDENGRAWLTNVPNGEYNFDGLVQFAFVMAVDGEITNALLFNA